MRIFVASPSDLAPERKILLQVIGRLTTEFKHHFHVQPVLWEHEPLLATEHFQEGLVSPAECDIVVSMLWSTLGSALPEKYRRSDGSVGITGTEWEYLTAVESYQRDGRPEILFYNKTTPVQVTLDDAEAVRKAQYDKQRVDEFIQRYFHNEDDAQTFKKAYWTFDSIDRFEADVYTHLSALLKEHAGRELAGGEDEAQALVWHKGSPFRGLEPFELEHADIYFGRNRARNDLYYQFRSQVRAHCPFTMVLGTSGSGKSSLVKAGLMPMILTPGVLPGVAEVRWCTIKPSDDADDLVAALLRGVTSETCMHELAPDEAAYAELSTRVKATPHALETLVYSGLNAIKQSTGYRPELSVRLLVVVDQFEELFTLPVISDTGREAFVSVLTALARSEHTWVVGTMRSDFYARSAGLPELVSLMRGNGQFHLTQPSAEEIAIMIVSPARAAGLAFEKSADGIGLDEVLRESAASHPAVLPLLSFTLDQLFAKRRGNLLTHEAYRELGGVEGAITRRANDIFDALSPACREQLPSLLGALTTIRGGDDETIAARRASWAFIAESPTRRELAEAFVQARLLVVAGNIETGDASVGVAHEALLRSWGRAREWIDANLEFLRAQSRIATTAKYWELEGHTESLLIPEGSLLDIAVRLFEQQRASLSQTEAEYIQASVALVDRLAREAEVARAAKRRARRRALVATVAAAVVLLIVAGVLLQGREAQVKLERLAEQRTEQAKKTKVKSIAELSRRQTEAGDLVRGLQLAIEAAKQAETASEAESGEARAAMYAALWARPETIDFEQTPVYLDEPQELLRVGAEASLIDLQSYRRTSLGADIVEVAVVSPNGTRAVLYERDGNAAIWDLQSGSRVQTIGRSDALFEVAGTFGPSGKILVTFATDGRARVIDAWLGVLLHELAPSGPAPAFLAMSPATERLLMWEAAEGAALLDLVDGVRVPLVIPVWGTDGREVLDFHVYNEPLLEAEFHPRGVLLTEARNGRVSSWDRKTGMRIAQVSAPGEVAIRVSLDDERLAVSDGGHTVVVWSMETGLPLTRLRHLSPVAAMARGSKTSQLITLDEGGSVRTWDAAGERVGQMDTGLSVLDTEVSLEMITTAGRTPLAVITLGDRLLVLDLEELVTVVTVDVDRTLERPVALVDELIVSRSAKDVISVVDARSGRAVQTIQLPFPAVPIALDAEQHQVATLAGGDVLNVYDLRTGKKQFSGISPEPVTGARFVHRGRYLMTSSDAGSQLWTIDGGTRVAEYTPGFRPSAFALGEGPDGGESIVAIGGAGQVVIQASSSRAEIATHPVEGMATHLQFAPGDNVNLLAIGTNRGSITLVEPRGGPIGEPYDVPPPITDLSFTADGTRLLVADNAKRVHVLDARSSRPLTKVNHWDRVSGLQAAGGAKFYAMTSGGAQNLWSAGDRVMEAREEYPGRVDGMLKTGEGWVSLVRTPASSTEVFDPGAERAIGRLTLPKASISSFALSPDGSRLAVSTTSDVVQIWNLTDSTVSFQSPRTSELLTSLTEKPKGMLSKLLFSEPKESKRNVQAEIDRRVERSTSAKDRARTRETKLVFSPDGQRLGVGIDGEALFVFDAESQERLYGARRADRMIGFTLDGSAMITENDAGELLELSLASGEAKAAKRRELLGGRFRADVRLVRGEERLLPFADGERLDELASGWEQVIEVLDVDVERARVVARGQDGGLRLLEGAEGRLLAHLGPPKPRPRDARFTRDGSQVLTSDGTTVRAWPVYEGSIRKVSEAVLAGIGNR